MYQNVKFFHFFQGLSSYSLIYLENLIVSSDMSILKKLNISSFRQFCLINLVFAITGSLAVVISGYLTDFLGESLRQDLPILYWSFRIIGIFIVYQVILWQLQGFSFLLRSMMRIHVHLFCQEFCQLHPLSVGHL